VSRILLIEADPAERLVLHSRIVDYGHEVVVAENGARGLVEARTCRFDLVLLASRLGGGVDGAEVCRRLKAAPQLQLVPVVVYCQEASCASAAERLFDAGCEQFLTKAQMPLLERVIEVQLRLKARADELSEQARTLEMENRRLEEGIQSTREIERRQAEGTPALVQRELAASCPDGLLVADESGFVCYADRGACSIFGTSPVGQRLGRIAPSTGLEAFARDARNAPREGFRFDLPANRPGGVKRALVASVIPLASAEAGGTLRLVVLLDVGRRRIAEELSQIEESGIPRQQLGSLLEAARATYVPEALVGNSQAVAMLRARLVGAARCSDPVLLAGEAGAGKELCARIVHYTTQRGGNFLQLKCGSLTEAALEAELFGHVKGAHPGAVADRPGLMLLAQDGTLYLEDIGDLPPALQERLIEVLDSGSLLRRGARRRERVDCRLLASCEASPASLVSAGKLLPELYRRLAAVTIEVPPLRGRIDDVLPLTEMLLRRFGLRHAIQGLSEDAAWVLVQYDWPRNVDELEESIEQACHRAQGGAIELAHLPRALRDLALELPRRELIPPRRSEARVGGGTILAIPLRTSDQRAAVALHPAPPKAWQIGDEDPISLEHYEMKALLRALDSCNGDKLAAAKLLKVGKSTLYRKLKKFGIP